MLYMKKCLLDLVSKGKTKQCTDYKVSDDSQFFTVWGLLQPTLSQCLISTQELLATQFSNVITIIIIIKKYIKYWFLYRMSKRDMAFVSLV